MIQNRKRCSKTGKDVLKCSIFWQFCPKKCAKVCKSAITHRTPKKGPHARTSRTISRMDFAHTSTCSTAHRTCACAYAPSQLIPCILVSLQFIFIMDKDERIGENTLHTIFLKFLMLTHLRNFFVPAYVKTA